MNTSQVLNLITRLAGFKLVVRANRFGCDSDLAREAHDCVMAVLDGYRGELSELIHLESEAVREVDPERQDDLLYHLVQCHRATENNWYEGQPFEIGGWHRSQTDGSFRDPVTGTDRIVGDSPLVLDIPDGRLSGLQAILADIEIECGISFSCEIVFYKPRPESPKPSKAIESFDPEADIPW